MPESQDDVLRILGHRFHEISPETAEKVRGIADVSRLDALIDQALDVQSPADLLPTLEPPA